MGQSVKLGGRFTCEFGLRVNVNSLTGALLAASLGIAEGNRRCGRFREAADICDLGECSAWPSTTVDSVGRGRPRAWILSTLSKSPTEIGFAYAPLHGVPYNDLGNTNADRH